MDAIREHMAGRVVELERQREQLREACQLLVDSLEGKPVEPEEAIGAIRAALKATEEDV